MSGKFLEGLDFGDFKTLSELDADGSVVLPTGSSELPLSSIIEDPDQPRTVFDEDALNDLAGSIRERGVLQAITVRPANADGKHVIVMGARRYRASLLAGRDTIPAVIRVEASDSYDQMVENIQREALSHRDIAAFIRDQLATGAKKAAIAKGLGKSAPWVSIYVDFFEMDPLIQKGVESYGIRPAYELHAAMQIDAEATRSFMVSGSAITQRSATALRQALKAKQDGSSSPSQAEPSTVHGLDASATGVSDAQEPNGAPAAVDADIQNPSNDDSVQAVDSETARKARNDVAIALRLDESPPGSSDATDGVPAESDHDQLETVSGAKYRKPVSLTLLVRFGERIGRLLLDREPVQGRGYAIVAFVDGEEEVRVSDFMAIELVNSDEKEADDA